MSWQAGSTRVYSQPSNQGFPGTRQSTQLLAADREGGSVAGYWQTLFESASEETFIYLKMLSPFPPARFVDWYVHCWTDSLSSEKYFGVIQATIISIKVSGYVLPIQWKQAASPQNRNHPTKLLQQRISICTISASVTREWDDSFDHHFITELIQNETSQMRPTDLSVLQWFSDHTVSTLCDTLSEQHIIISGETSWNKIKASHFISYHQITRVPQVWAAHRAEVTVV